MKPEIKIVEESARVLADYGRVPISFLVDSTLKVERAANGLGGIRLVEERVAQPYIKDYDADDNEGPTRWGRQWDLSNWGILSAFDGPTRVGGAAIAWKTSGVNMLEGRDDLAVLWDIRVAPEYRGYGIGRALFQKSVAWARERGCVTLKIETQNINVRACKFYAANGCVLGAISTRAYPEYPDETQLLWYLDL